MGGSLLLWPDVDGQGLPLVLVPPLPALPAGEVSRGSPHCSGVGARHWPPTSSVACARYTGIPTRSMNPHTDTGCREVVSVCTHADTGWPTSSAPAQSLPMRLCRDCGAGIRGLFALAIGFCCQNIPSLRRRRGTTAGHTHQTMTPPLQSLLGSLPGSRGECLIRFVDGVMATCGQTACHSVPCGGPLGKSGLHVHCKRSGCSQRFHPLRHIPG